MGAICNRTRSAALVAVVVSLATALSPPQARADNTDQLTELVDAAAERLQIADPVAAFKWGARLAIEDPEREQQELARLGDEAGAHQIDPGYVTRVFRDQINATVAIQYSRFGDWKLNPAGVPAAPPDLSASRSAIDTLNKKILDQIARNWSLLHGPACTPQLDSARSAAIGVRRLDSLYQRALSTATQSYCQSPPST